MHEKANSVPSSTAANGRSSPPPRRYRSRPEVGHLLYALTLAARPTLIVEFGASLGVSTIYLASALREIGGGSITQLSCSLARRSTPPKTLATPASATSSRSQRRCIGLALSIDGKVDLLFLDGSNDLYLPALELGEPHLSTRAFATQQDCMRASQDSQSRLGPERDLVTGSS